MSFCNRLSVSILSLTLLGLPLAQAADPASGEINAEALKLEWAGSGPYVVPNLTPAPGDPVPVLCDPTVPVSCDQFTLNVNLSDEFRELPENQRESARIGIDFPVTTGAEDYDLYIYDAGGALVGSSTNLNGIVESVTVPLKTLKNGAYTVTIIPFTPMATNYSGIAQVGKDAKSAGAGFSLTPQVGSAPLSVILDARDLARDPPAGGYVFEFGDGTAPVMDEDGVVEHTFQEKGQYLSRVRFSDPGSPKNLASASQTVFVGDLDVVGKAGAHRMGGSLNLGLLLGLAAFGVAGRGRRRVS